ncbi:MAG: glycosyltransferase [Alistipes sp.]|nr:glycosyltransferase [Alistipes sp.]
MKKIIILYGPVSQKHLIDSVISHCSSQELQIIGFNTGDWTFNNNHSQIPIFYKLLSKWLNVRKIGGLIYLLFFTSLLKKVTNGYDAIDVTFFTKIYYPFLNYCVTNQIPYKITIWGSDFYRTSKADLQKKLYYFTHARLIQVETESVKEDLVNIFPSIKDKIEVCNYGVDLFDYIDSQRTKINQYLKLDTRNKIVVTCGYNGSKGQQHYKIIEELSKLPTDVKRKLFLFFPMTYGVPDAEYIDKLKTNLSSLDIAYHIFTRRLSEYELADLRLMSNIALNIQITDALSSSLIEHIYAGSTLVVGNWLPYSIFSKFGIRYISIEESEISNTIQQLCESDNSNINFANISAAKQMSSWCIIGTKLNKLFIKLFTIQ